ncbi:MULTISPECIES: staygreen family protein [Clostridium]|uniref:Staygreen family protein n=1 Tax=Clostridium frigoriphilum TaxID=443253 RepID=A0ABU7UU46_9CLOT|nr:staygreen family protein [Clostridium sp. DSM 17811]MBU3100898.1 staygreen family protein [Clostridium sp. DSM 17811]
MNKFNMEMLHVNFGMRTGETKPIIPRKYTLTHSDVTGEFF